MANEQNLKPFQPGQSGNPAGKPSGARNRSTIIREMLAVMRELPDHLKGEFPEFEGKVTFEQAITLAQLNRASDGDTNAYKAVMDSAYGAPKQEIESTQRITIIDDL